jgi:predicted nucleic acid-binding protein
MSAGAGGEILDSSAIVPLMIVEPSSARVRNWFDSDSEIIVWTLPRVELLSAIARLRREDSRSATILTAARRNIMRAWDGWSEITNVELVRRHAEQLVESYPLDVPDALQLGAALIAAERDPANLDLVTLDRNLADAAEREGFAVLGP